MNPDLQNKINSEAIREFKGTACTESNRNAFKYGASFVAGILQPEIDRLKICDAHATIFQMENTHLYTRKDGRNLRVCLGCRKFYNSKKYRDGKDY